MKLRSHLLSNWMPLLVLALSFTFGCQQKTDLSEFATSQADPLSLHGRIIPGEYILTLKDEAVNPAPPGQKFVPSSPKTVDPHNRHKERTAIEAPRIEFLIQQSEEIFQENELSASSVKQIFPARIPALLISVQDEQDANTLRNDPRIASIEPNRIIALGSSPLIKTPFNPSNGIPGKQQNPYGLHKVGGSRDKSNSSAKAWIVDTGIDLDHEDLNVSVSLGANFTSDPSMDDGHGHGTHVAGIIGAINNGIGVKGVAAGIKVIPVKVLDDQGYGSTADVLAGLIYVASQCRSGDAVNISLGGEASDAIDQAVLDIAATGARVFIAAGNMYQDISMTSPARVNGNRIYTIAASDLYNQFAPYSNYGTGIDWIGPGTDILSTYKDNSYGYYSGTSMAAPHIAGFYLKVSDDIENGIGITMPNGQTKYIPAEDD